MAAETLSAKTLASIRVAGGVKALFKASGGYTRIAHLHEHGGFRLGFPTTHAPHVETVLVNSGGGIAGGDRLTVDIAAGDSTDVVFTTTSAERIYRSTGADAHADIKLSIAPGARLDWLPQQTILYAGARLRRRFDVDVASRGRLLLAEMTTFGRIASGELASEGGSFRDDWRIRRDGCLLFAEATHAAGPMAELLARPAIADGARAAALLLLVSEDAADCLAAIRASLAAARSICAASSWNGMVSVRFLAARPEQVRHDLAKVIGTLTRRALPRVWSS